MEKPRQSKHWYKADASEMFEAIESAMASIRDAMEELRGLEMFADHFNALGDVFDDMKPDYEMYEDITSAEYEAEIAALTRDYYRSVI